MRPEARRLNIAFVLSELYHFSSMSETNVFLPISLALSSPFVIITVASLNEMVIIRTLSIQLCLYI